jgi:hypothetical protein
MRKNRQAKKSVPDGINMLSMVYCLTFMGILCIVFVRKRSYLTLKNKFYIRIKLPKTRYL